MSLSQKSCDSGSKSCDSGSKATDNGVGEIVADNEVGLSHEGDIGGESSCQGNDTGCGQQKSIVEGGCGEGPADSERSDEDSPTHFDEGDDRGASMSRETQCHKNGERNGMGPDTESGGGMECGPDMMAGSGSDLPAAGCVESCETGDDGVGDMTDDTKVGGCGLKPSGCGQLECTVDHSIKTESISTSSEDRHDNTCDNERPAMASIVNTPDDREHGSSCNGPVQFDDSPAHLNNGDGLSEVDGPQSVLHRDTVSASLVEWAREYAGMSIKLY